VCGNDGEMKGTEDISLMEIGEWRW